MSLNEAERVYSAPVQACGSIVLNIRASGIEPFAE
jgi:hypothetical protein